MSQKFCAHKKEAVVKVVNVEVEVCNCRSGSCGAKSGQYKCSAGSSSKTCGQSWPLGLGSPVVQM